VKALRHPKRLGIEAGRVTDPGFGPTQKGEYSRLDTSEKKDTVFFFPKKKKTDVFRQNQSLRGRCSVAARVFVDDAA
jgi:hypothetical protein